MSQFEIIHTTNENRIELHDKLHLTGCEASINILPAGTEIPFVHYHTQNEELYMILDGEGLLYADKEISPLVQGDCFRLNPSVHRCLKALKHNLKYICIQARAKSLTQYTLGDAKIADGEKPNW